MNLNEKLKEKVKKAKEEEKRQKEMLKERDNIISTKLAELYVNNIRNMWKDIATKTANKGETRVVVRFIDVELRTIDRVNEIKYETYDDSNHAIEMDDVIDSNRHLFEPLFDEIAHEGFVNIELNIFPSTDLRFTIQ